MAFSGNPALVVADEPTTALDVVTQARIVRLIADQQALHNTAVLLITHDLKLAAHVCKTVAVMYAGDMVEAGPASVVLGAPSHPYTRSLLAAVPAITGPRRVLPALADFMPGLARFGELDGCRFAPRCPVKDDACRGERVAPRMVGDRHWARCSHACSEFSAIEGEVLMAAPAASVASTPAAVELRDVSLTYRSSGGFLGLRQKSFEAVKAVTFSVRRGEMLGIVGESGSGKSSIARMIVGLEQPSNGSIRVNGDDSQKVAHLTRRDAQMIFQDPQSALNPRRSVLRLLTQAMEVEAPKPSSERYEIAGRLLRETGLPEDCLHRFPSELSGGQKQRVNIGRALCVMPEVVVADEIVSGLDVSIQAHILNLLLDLNRRHGITVILISHDLAVVRYLCPRSLIMYRGEIVEEGLTDEIFDNPRHTYTRTLLAAIPQESVDMKRTAFAATAAQ
jgi:peptide/nickel transport system ATP-binding protein